MGDRSEDLKKGDRVTAGTDGAEVSGVVVGLLSDGRVAIEYKDLDGSVWCAPWSADFVARVQP